MELVSGISNNLLVGGIFAVLIFGLVGSQHAMAGDEEGPNGITGPLDIEITKTVSAEGSAGSILLREVGGFRDTGNFVITARVVADGSSLSVLIQDKLPGGLLLTGVSKPLGTTYDPDTGVWDVGTVFEGSRTLTLFFEVLPGTCGANIVNRATLTSGDANDSNDSAFATVSVVQNIKNLDENCPSTGGGDHESPTIGKNAAGIQIVPSNGICIDAQCWTVTEFDTGFELLPLLSSSHTITNTIFCNEGVQECDYVGISFMTSTDLFGELVMMVEAQKTDGDWIISWYDPQDFIHDPGDYLVGDPRGAITFTAQIVNDAGFISENGNFLLTSFTIDFKNKNTDVLVIRIQVGDEERGQSTFWFNEGVEIIDSDAYPSIETEFEKPLEIDSLCLNEDPNYRYSCGFAKILERTIQNAEETLWQMLNGEYIYK